MPAPLRFRVWHNRKMSDVLRLELRDFGLFEILVPHGDDAAVIVDVKNATVMQSTGLKDKTGKDIFEGDILSYANPTTGNRNVGEVVWYEETVGMRLRWLKSREITGLQGVATQQKRWEIIGNIHKNPDLLP